MWKVTLRVRIEHPNVRTPEDCTLVKEAALPFVPVPGIGIKFPKGPSFFIGSVSYDVKTETFTLFQKRTSYDIKSMIREYTRGKTWGWKIER